MRCPRHHRRYLCAAHGGDQGGEGTSHQQAERTHAGADIHAGAHDVPHTRTRGYSLKELGPVKTTHRSSFILETPPFEKYPNTSGLSSRIVVHESPKQSRAIVLGGKSSREKLLKTEHTAHILHFPLHGSAGGRAEGSEMREEFGPRMKRGWGEGVLIFASASHYLNLFSLAIH